MVAFGGWTQLPARPWGGGSQCPPHHVCTCCPPPWPHGVPRLAPSPSDVPLWGLSLLTPSCRPQHHVSMSVHRRGAEGEWTGREVSRGTVLGNRLPVRSPSLLSRALQREHLVRSAGVRRKGALCQGPHTKQIQGLFLLSTRPLCTRKARLPPSGMRLASELIIT